MGVREQILHDFGPVWDAAGLRNFYGQGWRHSWIHRLLGLDLSGSTFVSKTTTTDPRTGNTPLRKDLKTQEFKPSSVVLKFWGGHTLNAWGLSGPGAEVVLNELSRLADSGAFTALQLSFMPVGDDKNDLLRQTRGYTQLLRDRLYFFGGLKLLIQFNASCPNTGHDLRGFQGLLFEHLEILSELEIPIVVKESVDTPFDPMRRVVEHPACSGIVTTNCPKFGSLPDKIPWEEIFGTKDPKQSPLAKFGGGGYSGPYLLPLVEERVREYRASGYNRHINAGGGIRTAADARRLHEAGADSVFIGATCVNYAPWNARAIIREARSWSAQAA